MNTEYNAPTYWTTFDGKKIPVREMEHSHLSNLYWFFRIIHNTTKQWALDEIKKRFNGQLLPYSPHLGNVDEISFLEINGLLKWRTHTKQDIAEYGDIILFGKKIGEIIRPITKPEHKLLVTVKIEHYDDNSVRVIIFE